MRAWNALEVCQLAHTTQDYYVRLADFLSAWIMEHERRYVKMSMGNLYNELVRRHVHGGREKSRAKLPGTCKAIFYILQNMHYVETGAFCRTKAEPLAQLQGEGREIPAPAMHREKEYAFAKASGRCARALHRL